MTEVVDLVSRTVFRAYGLLPASTRWRLKRLAGTSGHSVSFLDELKSSRDAKGKKRLDRAIVSMAMLTKSAGIYSLAGFRTLEIGSGYVPSDALALYLLGSDEVVASDYNRIASIKALRISVAACDRRELIRLLEQYAGRELDHAARLASLLDALKTGWSALKELGIDYVAPLDLSLTSDLGGFDLVCSVSVLEHLPRSMVIPIMENLSVMLSRSGVMVHDVDLEDHIDFESRPFDFLSESGDYVEDRDTDARGNSIRTSEWMSLLSKVPGLSTTIVQHQSRSDIQLDSHDLRPHLRLLESDDLYGSRAVLACRKKEVG